MPRDEVVDVGHVGQHVVAQQQVGLAVLARDLARAARGRRSGPWSGTPFSTAASRDVGRRLDAQHRHAARDEMLQQVAVVAGDLHHLAAGPSLQRLDRHLGVAPRMLDPAGRVGREVGVLGEDLLRRDELLQLHQEALVADVGVQRIERLHLVQLLGRDVRLAQRRHAEIDEGRGERRRRSGNGTVAPVPCGPSARPCASVGLTIAIAPRAILEQESSCGESIPIMQFEGYSITTLP